MEIVVILQGSCNRIVMLLLLLTLKFDRLHLFCVSEFLFVLLLSNREISRRILYFLMSERSISFLLLGHSLLFDLFSLLFSFFRLHTRIRRGR